MPKVPEDWRTLDLQDRRYITIADDLVEDSPQGEGESGNSAGRTNAKDLLPYAPLAVPLLLIPVVGQVALIAAAVTWLKRAVAPPVAILRVPRRLVGGIDFGPSGWEPNVVYAANPKLPTMYRSLASFHEALLVHKISELERLLNALGAREYSIRHVERGGRGSSGTAEAGVAGGGISLSSSELTERQWSGTSDGHPPLMPDRLTWFEGEPEWRNLAESRLSGSRRAFAFSVSQVQDFGVDANLAASVEALNLGIGGSYRSVKEMSFSVSGTF